MRAHAVARVAQMVLTILLVPYVLAHLSREEYGLWSWLLALSGWVALADVGLSSGNVNPLARALAAKDERRIGETIVAAVCLHVVLAAIVVATAVLAGGVVTSAVPPESRSLAFETLLLLIVAQCIQVVSFPLGAMLSALQRQDLVHKLQSAQLAIQGVGTVVILAAGGRVFELAWLHCGLAAVQLAGRLALCVRLHPSLRPGWPARKELPGLLSTGLPVVVLGLAGSVALNYERTFLGFVVDLALLAQYAIATRLVMAVREVPLVLFSALIPTSAALDVAGDQGALERLHARSFKLAAFLNLMLTATLWVCGPLALRAWLGEGFEAAGDITRPLAIGFLIPLVCAPATQILTGRSRLARLAPIYVLWAITFVVGNTLWLRSSGFAGAGWGTAVIDVFWTVVLLDRLRRGGELGAAGVAGVLGRAGASAAVAAVIGEVVVGALDLAFVSDSRSVAALLAACGAAAIFATQVLLAWALGLVDAEDRRLVAGALGLERRLDRSPPFA
jgi:O-antigen/teichoic acid export membrane protein